MQIQLEGFHDELSTSQLRDLNKCAETLVKKLYSKHNGNPAFLDSLIDTNISPTERAFLQLVSCHLIAVSEFAWRLEQRTKTKDFLNEFLEEYTLKADHHRLLIDAMTDRQAIALNNLSKRS